MLAIAAAALWIVAPPRAGSAKQPNVMFTSPVVLAAPVLANCSILNVDDVAHEITIDVIRATNGDRVISSFTRTLDPGIGVTIGFSPISGVTTAYYCKFTLSSEPEHYRANLQIQSATSNTAVLVNPAILIN